MVSCSPVNMSDGREETLPISSHQLTLQQKLSAAEGAKRCDFTSPTSTAHISNLSENMKPQIGARCCKGLIIGWIGSQGISIGYEVVTSHSSV